MIDRKQVMPISFLKLEKYTGSYQGMRYRMEKAVRDEEERLLITIWPEPFACDYTPEEEKRTETFAFSEEGILNGIDWMNRQYEDHRDRWERS